MAASPTMRRRLLGLELRSMRDRAGVTAEETADRMGWHPSKMTRLETGRSGLRVQEVTALLDFYGVSEAETRDTLLSLAREGKRRTWWQPYNDLLAPKYKSLIAFESEAQAVRNYELALVPGLLQTPDYARSITRATRPDDVPEDINALVEVRLQRQAQALSREKPLQMWAILDEAVLRRPVGGVSVMTHQLRALVEATDRPNINIQVLPYERGAHLGLLGSFVILEFPVRNDLDVVYVEGQGSTAYLEREQDRTTYSDIFNRLRSVALDVDTSREIMTQAIKDMI